MRFGLAIGAALALASCAPTPADEAAAKTQAMTPPPANYDYRYAFRLPGDRIKALQESHARGCEQLGPARCRITAMRYAVDDNNRVAGVLTLTLDPALARAFGKAATDRAVQSRGALIESQVLADPAAGSVPARLSRAADDADAKLKLTTDGEERAALAADAARARAAIATISALDRANGAVLATAPVLISYTSGSGTGIGAASFDDAGETLLVSLAGLATLLAGVGPWLLLLLGGALLLRRIVHRDEAARPVTPVAVPATEPRSAVQRWFQRDPVPIPEHDRTDA